MSYIKKKSAKQEARTAKEFGGRTQVASGALWGAKGDVRCNEFLIENKYTDKPYFSLKHEIWNKIRGEAILDNLRIPLMQIDIQDVQLVVIDYYDVIELMDGAGLSRMVSVATNNKSFKLDKRAFNLRLGEFGVLKFLDYNRVLYVFNKDQFQILLDSKR